MVDVTDKDDSRRTAVAEGAVHMRQGTVKLISDGQIGKGDVLAVAQVAGIMAAKRTWELIPMCHPLLLTGVDLAFVLHPEEGCVTITATVTTTGKTGVEMEALTAVSAAALTIYDMCKAVDRGMTLDGICLVLKAGGKSGVYEREAGR